MTARTTMLGSMAAAAVLVALMVWNAAPGRGPVRNAQPLLVFCAAGLKPVLDPVVHEYESKLGIKVQVQYGGSGTLLSNIRVSGVGDLFLAADESYIESARTNKLIEEVVPLALMSPVVAVPKGNPGRLKTLADLLKPEVKLVLPNPDAAAIGRVAKVELGRLGLWDGLSARARAFKPTVNDLANDLKLGSADASILWDATVRQYPEIEALPGDFFGGVKSTVSVSVLASTKQPREALRFARYLGSPEHGAPRFKAAGFTPTQGDAWVETPAIVLFSGGVNRVAIEETLRQFEDREGVTISRVYNGCGILTAQIKSGQKPDAYFACDVSFMKNVQEEFRPALELSETRMMIVTARGNPHGLQQLQDLGRKGLKVGLANEQQSALGSLTARLLRAQRLYESVMSNVAVQTPTADLLINQLRAGGLDAAVVYEANTRGAGDQLTAVPILLEGATAVQPLAVGKSTRYPMLLERLKLALISTNSQARFSSSGFQWRGPAAQ